ncbi:MAG TPA: glycosyltransferase [Acetobacteraceae bacterium]|jgi:glycosyltransferase involved in cell wall biosynthesis|nr:glycosyltransferase [Acetobacteraceae bacterium]
MRALVLSLLKPPRPGVDVHGTYKRIPLHVRALHALGASIEMAYYVTDGDVPASADLAEAARAQEAAEAVYWGFAARVHLIRRRPRPPQTFRDYYLKGVAAAADQPALSSFAGPEQAAAVGALLDTGPDLVVVNNLHATCAVLRSGRRARRLFVDLDDVQHLVRLRWCRQPPRTPGRLMMLSHIPALIAAERAAARRAEATFVCSEADRAHLARLGLPRVAVVPNAVDVPPDPPGPAAEPVLLFVGGMGHEPNHEAAERMVRRIFPLIRRERPDARLLVAGSGSECLPSRAGNPPGVAYCGFVPDIGSLFARSAVFVCPMLNGGGTRIKVLDAAAHALPIVSTHMGAGGISLADGKEIVLRDTDEAFAHACLHVLSDHAMARRIGAAARAVIQRRYDAASVESQLEGFFREPRSAAAG